MAKLGNLASRFLVAAVAFPIVGLVLYAAPDWATWLLVMLAAVLAMQEFFAMTLQEDGRDRAVSLICGAISAAALYWLEPQFLVESTGNVGLATAGPLVVVVVAIMPISLYYLFRFGDMKTVAPRFAYSITGIVYVGLLLSFLALIRRDFGPHGSDLIVFVLLVAWIGDTGAYFAGRFLGKRKLYPEVSPKKTWAGAFGGIAASTASAAALEVTLLPELPWVDVLVLAIPGAALGQMGDLVESLFKRSTGVKDSGSILPGHGGMLDRVDAVLFMAPYVYTYLLIRQVLPL